MRALLLDRLPNIATATKVDRLSSLNGVKVNDAAMVQALLKYGTYDAYYYIRESAGNFKEDAYEYRDRLHSLDLGSLESLREEAPDELVLFTSSHHLAKFVPFRQFCNHTEWPICGITHGLSDNTLIPAYAWNYFSASKSYDAIICTSRAGKRSVLSLMEGLGKSRSVAGVRDFYPPRLPWIPLGIEISNDQPRTIQTDSKRGLVALSIGRFSPSHKADLRPLIAAFLTSRLFPVDSTLILAGDDTESRMAAGLQEFAQSFSSPQKVIVLPDIPDQTKQALLQTADVALCMSDTYQETFGLSVLEAMAAGLPVVAPDWDGYRDLIVHEHTGFLAGSCLCRDTGFLNVTSMLIDPAFALGQRVMIDIPGIINSLSILAANRDLAKTMGEAGRARAISEFSWKAIIPQYESLWDKLIRRGRTLHRASRVTELGYVDFVEVFRDHPQAIVPPETTVALGADDTELRARAKDGSLFTPPPIAGFSQELDTRILDLCGTGEVRTIADLVTQLRSASSGPSMVLTQISRLVKYGLLTLSVNEDEATLNQEHQHEQLDFESLSPIGV